MTSAGWRLLAAFLLIFVVALLRGQDSAADRPGVPTPNSDLQRYAPRSAQVWVPVSEAPRRDPVEGYPVGNHPIGNHPVGNHPIVSGPIVSGPIAFPQIVQAAGIIFSGSVSSVARTGASKGPASTAVTFKVERAMRGASAGQSLTIREWAGLWSRGERYRVGERVLLFLYAPSRLGLTSPVAGAMGRFAIDSAGQIALTPQHFQILSTDPILGGKTVVSSTDFAVALQRFTREE